MTQTVESLAYGMQRAETTQGWDVMVSYSLDELNELLKKIWFSDPDASAEFYPVTQSYDPRTEEYYNIEWSIVLASPSLQFTIDGRASLCMDLSGKWRVEGLKPDGTPYPWKIIPSNCTFTAIVPLQSVRAREGDTKGTDPTPGDQTIAFDDDPDVNLHAVFNFDNDKLSKYTIEGGEEGDIFQPLAPKLQGWMSDHISTIQFSLAVVSPTMTVGATYLTPLSMGFTVYKYGTEGCLSVTIQTKDSGNPPGNATRVFTLPNDSGKEALPLAKGYGASIIIRRKLFNEKFLVNSLRNTTSSGHNAFQSVTPLSTSNGFSFELTLNNAIIDDFTNLGWDGTGLISDKIDWKLSDTPLRLTITNGSAAWDYSGHFHVGWMQNTGTGSNPWGVTHWDPSIGKSGQPIMSTDQHRIEAKIDVHSDWWKASIWAEDAKPLIGKWGIVPGDLRNALNKIALPTFTNTMRLDFFATTNIFAPGKHIIDIDTNVGVITPYDVLLVGKIIQPAAARGTSGGNVAKSLRWDHQPIHRVSAAASSLVVEIATGQPILLDLIDVFYTKESTKTVGAVLHDHGYQVTPEDMQLAVRAAQSGRDFDIRTVAGMYKFTEPSDMVQTRMEVVPTTGQIYINGVAKQNDVDEQGRVVWKDGGLTYTITFEARYEDDGAPKPITFGGTRKGSGENVTVVKGEQRIPAAHWTAADWALTAAWMATMFGTGFGVVVWALDHFQKGTDREAAQRRFVDGAERASAALPDMLDDAAAPLVDLSDFQRDIEGSMEMSVYDSLRTIPEADTTNIERTRQAAGSEGISQMRELIAETIQPSLRKAYEPYVRYSRRADAIDVITDGLVDRVAGPKKPSFSSSAPYVQQTVDADIQRHVQTTSHLDATKFRNAAEQDALDIEQYKANVTTKKEAKRVREEELRREGQTDAEIARDAEIRRLVGEIAAEEEHQRESERSKGENERKETEADKKAEEAERKEREARQKAEHEAKDVYR
ncbi:hypothetical protein AB1N83_007084 [Pleurotus pulmonarius]